MFSRIFLLSVILSSCSSSKKILDRNNPPGTVQLNDTLFVDKAEVGNIYWREYLFYLNVTEKDETTITAALPDTSVWNTETTHNPFTEYYFRHPGYNNYPVVGITYKQAVDFCKWRTFVVNFGSYLRENKFADFKEHLDDSFPIKFIYRLPTQEEWEMIAAGKMSINEYPYGYKNVYTKWKGKNAKMFNCLYPGDTSNQHFSYKIYTSEINAFFPNSYGTYNMIGNVAEMVSKKGIAKGGSFIHSLDSCKISSDQYYTKPERWLGFRCVAVKVK